MEMQRVVEEVTDRLEGKAPRNVSIDIETLGLGADAHILSIAAVPFDIITGTIYSDEALHLHITTDGQGNRHVDPDVVRWWLAQDPALAAETLLPARSLKLGPALIELHRWYRGGNHSCVWGNGATFDIAILEHAYRALSLRVPWKFYDARDMRTIVAISRDLGYDPKSSVVFVGSKHEALADATYQAQVISSAYRRIIRFSKEQN